jgi:hypothetical protein
MQQQMDVLARENANLKKQQQPKETMNVGQLIKVFYCDDSKKHQIYFTMGLILSQKNSLILPSIFLRKDQKYKCPNSVFKLPISCGGSTC